MKIFYTQLNKTNQDCTEGFFKHTIYNLMEQTHRFVGSPEEADVVMFFYCYYNDYTFDGDMAKRIKIKGSPIVVFDYIENGSTCVHREDYLYKYQILGYKYECYDSNPLTSEYQKMADYFTEFQPQIKLYFKREMSSHLDFTQSPFKIIPIEYPINFDHYLDAAEEDYYKRPHDLYFNYGLSNGDRFRMHGKLLLEADRIGHNIIQTEKLEEFFLQDSRRGNIVIFHREWMERVDFKKKNSLAKTTLDLYGAGMKCFRSTEGTIDTLAFKQNPSLLQYSYPWVDGENCIYLPVGDNNKLDVNGSFEVIYDYLRGDKQNKLYKIYLKSTENNRLYRSQNYIPDYILKNII